MPHKKNSNQDVVWKTAAITLLVVVLFLFFNNTLNGSRAGFFLNLYSGQRMDFSSQVASILVIAVKILWFIFIVSLIIGLTLVIKKNLIDKKRPSLNMSGNLTQSGYACPCCGTRLTAEFKFCPNCKASLKETCLKCGKELQVGWKCCPICGEEKPGN